MFGKFKVMLGKLKKWGCVAACIALTLPAVAQDANTADAAFTTFMTDLKDGITSKVTEMLPILGGVAVVAMVIFLAMFVYRKVKSFVGR